MVGDRREGKFSPPSRIPCSAADDQLSPPRHQTCAGEPFVAESRKDMRGHSTEERGAGRIRVVGRRVHDLLGSSPHVASVAVIHDRVTIPYLVLQFST